MLNSLFSDYGNIYIYHKTILVLKRNNWLTHWLQTVRVFQCRRLPPIQGENKGNTILPRRHVQTGSHWQEDLACVLEQGTPNKKSSVGVKGANDKAGTSVRTALE